MFSRGVGKETRFAPDDASNVEPFFNNSLKAKMNLSGFLSQIIPNVLAFTSLGRTWSFDWVCIGETISVKQ
jgi:hypothetical protein